MHLQGKHKSAAPWLVAMILNGRDRIGQIETPVSDLGVLARFSARLWDAHHSRWAAQRSFPKVRMYGLVRADDPGLDELGIERWREPVKSKLIVVGM